MTAPTIAYAAIPSSNVAPLVTTATPTTRIVPTTATTCSMRFSRARTRATCSLIRAPQPGHTPPRLTTRSLPHSGHSILVRSGIAVTNEDATSYRIRWQGHAYLAQDCRAPARVDSEARWFRISGMSRKVDLRQWQFPDAFAGRR